MAFLPPSRTFTAAQFKYHVIRISADIAIRGHIPILVGGTGLYVSSVIDNFEIPAVPPNALVRRALEKKTTVALYSALRKADPAYAARITANNRRYAIRALEVIAATGKPFSEAQGKGKPLFDVLQVALRRPRRLMYERINARVDVQMRRGLLAEAAKLGKRYGWEIPAMSGLGHRQLGCYLRGETALEDAVELIKRDTRHFAKRQMTWFRRDGRIRWVKTPAQAHRLVRQFLKAKKQKRDSLK
jgi:tRNA dimethylallyltransferase